MVGLASVSGMNVPLFPMRTADGAGRFFLQQTALRQPE
jgi:hypothetical protein